MHNTCILSRALCWLTRRRGTLAALLAGYCSKFMAAAGKPNSSGRENQKLIAIPS